jgi:hypothetical protein
MFLYIPYKWSSLQFLSNQLNITFTLVSSYTPVMAERPKEYDINSYGDYELALVISITQITIFVYWTSTQKIYVIINNICSLQLMGMIACVVIKMIYRL